MRKLANITIGDFKKKIDGLEQDIKKKHHTYAIKAEAKRIEEARARALEELKPEQTKEKMPDCPVDLVLPRGVYFSEKGIKRVDWDKPPGKYGRPTVEVATTPIVPTKIYREPNEHITSYEVAIKAKGFWRRVLVDGRVLFDSRRVLELADKGGAVINSATHLCKYFAQIIGRDDQGMIGDAVRFDRMV